MLFFYKKNIFVILDLTFGWIFAITFVFGNGADSFCLYRLYALQWWIMVYGFIFSGISADVVCFVSCLGRNVQGLIKVVGKLLQIQASQRDNGASFTCPYSIRWEPFPSATAAARFFCLFFLLSPLHMSSHFKHTTWFAMGYRIWCNTTLLNICKWQNNK